MSDKTKHTPYSLTEINETWGYYHLDAWNKNRVALITFFDSCAGDIEKFSDYLAENAKQAEVIKACVEIIDEFLNNCEAIPQIDYERIEKVLKLAKEAHDEENY